MKRMKRIATLLVTLLMCLSLCGCQALEDMRAAHAVWQEDGSLKWNGNVYRLLENVPDELQFYSGDTVWVTDADVPVLLSEVYGVAFDVDIEGVLMCAWDWEETSKTYYCREDQYDDLVAYLQQSVEMDMYFYSYWDYTVDGYADYYLTSEQQSIIDDLLATSSFTVVMDKDFYYYDLAGEYCLTLNKCDEKHLFSEYYVLEIVWKDGRFYLVTPDNCIGEVPTEYYDVMNEIAKAYYEAEVEPYL